MPAPEQLEPRRLLAATLNSGLLVITGESSAQNPIADAITVSLARHQSTVVQNGAASGAAGESDRLDVENLIGGQGDDELSGNSDDNILDGRRGNDTLFGGPGNDTFIANYKNNVERDVVLAEKGKDIIFTQDAQPDIIIGGQTNSLSFDPAIDYLQAELVPGGVETPATGLIMDPFVAGPRPQAIAAAAS